MVHHRHSHHSSSLLHMTKLHMPSVHLPKSHYKFSNFVNDVSTPFRGAVKDITRTFDHGIGTFGKIGNSITTPLIIIGVAGIAFIVINKGSIR